MKEESHFTRGLLPPFCSGLYVNDWIKCNQSNPPYGEDRSIFVGKREGVMGGALQGSIVGLGVESGFVKDGIGMKLGLHCFDVHEWEFEAVVKDFTGGSVD